MKEEGNDLEGNQLDVGLKYGCQGFFQSKDWQIRVIKAGHLLRVRDMPIKGNGNQNNIA